MGENLKDTPAKESSFTSSELFVPALNSSHKPLLICLEYEIDALNSSAVGRVVWKFSSEYDIWKSSAWLLSSMTTDPRPIRNLSAFSSTVSEIFTSSSVAKEMRPVTGTPTNFWIGLFDPVRYWR